MTCRRQLAALLASLAWTGVHAADSAAGNKVFAVQCAECHSTKEGKDKKGPSLFGIVGARSAQRPGFVYSDALKASGITWTPEKLDAYLAAPKKLVPGSNMKFDGLTDAGQRADLIEYLGTTKH